MFSRLKNVGKKSSVPKAEPPAIKSRRSEPSPFGSPPGSGLGSPSASVTGNQSRQPKAGSRNKATPGRPAPTEPRPSGEAEDILDPGFVRPPEAQSSDLAVLGINDVGTSEEALPSIGERVPATTGGASAAKGPGASTAAGAGVNDVAPSGNSSTALLPPVVIKPPKAKKGGGPLDDLVSTDERVQGRQVLSVLSRIASGTDASREVSVVCRGVIARPGQSLSKRLAYDLVKGGSVGDSDWEWVYMGLRTDTGKASPPEVAAAALSALQGLPPHRLAEALLPQSGGDGAPGRAAEASGTGRPSSGPSRPGLAARPGAAARREDAPAAQMPGASPDKGSAPAIQGPKRSSAMASDLAANLAALDDAISSSGIAPNRVQQTADSNTAEASPSTEAETSVGTGAQGDLAARIGACLTHADAEVRAAAVEAVGRIVASPADLAAIASSSAPYHVDTAVQWAERLGDSLLDGAPQVAAAACSAVAMLLNEAAGVAADGTPCTGAKAILPTEALIRIKPGLGSWVAGRAAAKLGWRATAGLSAVLRRVHGLSQFDQVHVIRMLVALLEYVAARDFDLAAPVVEEGDPLAMPTPAPHQRRSSDLIGSLEDVLEPERKLASGGELAGPWLIEVAGMYIAPFLECPAPALQFEAAQGLLRLSALARRVARTGRVAAPVAAAARWAPSAVTTVLDLWERQGGAGGSSAVVAAAAEHMIDLPAASQTAAARQLIPLIAKLPFASERADAFAKLWSAALALDLAARQAERAGDTVVTGADLKTILSDAYVMHIAGSSNTETDAVGKATYAAFRDELVAVLMAVVERHPWALRSSELLAGPTSQAPPPRLPEGGPQSAEAKLRAAKEKEAAKFAAEAAFRQRIGETVDWLGSAKISLQGTKACLGWHREPQGGLHSCTAVVDAWLRLLQKALHAARALRVAIPAANIPPKPVQNGRVHSEAHDAMAESAAVAEDGMTGKVGTLLRECEEALQQPLSQIITHWKALSPAVVPRAVWVVAHHANLPRRLPGQWSALLGALQALLLRGLTDESSRVWAAKQAVAGGTLAAHRFADAPQLPPGDADDLGDDDIEEAQATEGGLEGPQSAADDPAIAVEGLEAATAAVERLTALLLYNGQGDDFAWSLKELAGKFHEVVELYTTDPRARTDTNDRLGRAAQRLRAMAGRYAKPPPSEKEKARAREKRAKKKAEAAAAAEAAMPPEVTEAAEFNANLAAAGLQQDGTDANSDQGQGEVSVANGVADSRRVKPPPVQDEESEDEEELRALQTMVPDPGAAVEEGYPFGPPPSAVLVTTQRTARYFALEHAVGTAVSAAYGIAPFPGGGGSSSSRDDGSDVAGLPSLVEVMQLVGGQVGSDALSAAVELSGPTDPVRLAVQHEVDLPRNVLALAFVVYNRLPSPLVGLSVRVGTAGPLARVASGPCVVNIPRLPSRGSHIFRLRIGIVGFGRMEVQPWVATPGHPGAPSEALLLRTRPYTVSPVALLQAPSEVMSSAAFFQAWSPIPHTADVTALATAPGVDGGLAALSALERSPLARVLLTGLPALGGFQAAYTGKSLQDATVSLIATGQLLPFAETVAPPEAATAETAAAAAAAKRQAGMESLLGVGFKSDPLQFQAPKPPPKRQVSIAGSRVAVRLTMRSTSAEIVSAIEADKAAFVQDMFGDALVVGPIAEAVAAGGRHTARVAPAVAALKWAYQPMVVALDDDEDQQGQDKGSGSQTTHDSDDSDSGSDYDTSEGESDLAHVDNGSSTSESGSIVKRPNGTSPNGPYGMGSSDGSSAGSRTSKGHDSRAATDEEAPPPPVIAPGLFDAVAEEWQRLRLAVQDV